MSWLRRTGTGRNNIEWGGGSTSTGNYLRRTGTSRNNVQWLNISTSGTWNLLERTANGRNNIRWNNLTFNFLDLTKYPLMPQGNFLTRWCAQISIKTAIQTETGCYVSSTGKDYYNITGNYTLGDAVYSSEGGMIIHNTSKSVRDQEYNVIKNVKRITMRYGSTTKTVSVTKIYTGESQLVINNGTSNYGTAYWNCFVIPQYWPTNLSYVQFLFS